MSDRKLFATHREATEWARANLGGVITRNPEGEGFVGFPKNASAPPSLQQADAYGTSASKSAAGETGDKPVPGVFPLGYKPPRVTSWHTETGGVRTEHSSVTSEYTLILEDVFRGLLGAIGCTQMNRLDKEALRRFLLPLGVPDLLLLQASVEYFFLSDSEWVAAGRQKQGLWTLGAMRRMIRESLASKRVHEDLRNYRNGRPARPQSHHSRSDLYDAISPGDGERAYLGDGVWVSPDGSMSDDGR